MAKNKNSSQEPAALSSKHWSSRIEDLGTWAESNAFTLVVGFVVVVVVCVAAIGFSMYTDSKRLSYFEQASALEAQFEKDLNAPGSDQPATLTSEKIERLQPEVLSFVSSHPKADASRNLAIKWVSKLYDTKEYEKALEVMDQLQPSNDSLSGLAQLLKGSTLMQAGKTPESIEVFKAILKNKNWSFVHPEASYQMGLAYLNNEDTDAAIGQFQNVQDSYQDSTETAQQATKIMRWLQYKKSQETNE